MPEPPIHLTDSQVQQMIEFYEEKGEGRGVLLQVAPSLGTGYLELIVLDEEGMPSLMR